MNIGKKLITSFLGVSAITLLLGIVGYYGAVKSDEAIREIGINRMPSVESLLIMGDAQTTVDSAENALLSREISLKDRQSKYADFSIALKRADEAWKVYDPLPQMPEEKLVADKFYPAAWEAWKRDHDAFVELSKQYDKTLEGEQKGDTLARANDLYKKMSDQALVKNGITFDAANNLLDKLVELNHKYGADATKDALAQAATLKFLNLIVMVAGVATALLLGTVVSRGIVHPIRQAADMLKDISEGEGDLTKRLKVTTNDEIGEMATSFNKFVEKLQHVVVGIVANAKAVNLSVTELSTVSNQTAAAVTSMSEKTCTVATAAEEASANTVSVAASMEQTSTNLSSVAAATEEMSATVGEIATNSEKARVISSQATSQAESVSALMEQLGVAAKEIDKVTETITRISAQTNLLALNATIEAASAGDAGRGFAVVANEIKELARQTDQATENIKEKISGIQSSTDSAITGIKSISGVINDVGSIIVSIAAAIEEQSSVTKAVAGNIAQASIGVKDANIRIAQTATVSKSMAGDLAHVTAAVADVRQGGEHVRASTVELSKVAEQLKTTAGQFKV